MTATRRSTAVERHPQFKQIVEWMALGESGDKIAAKIKPRLDPATLWRFKRNRLQESLQPAATVVQVLQRKGIISTDDETINATVDAVVRATTDQVRADPLTSRIAQHRATVDERLKEASPRDAAALISADLRGLELEAKLTGRLDTGTTASITVVKLISLPKTEAPVIECTAEVVPPADPE